jgi:exodeoxyribonuclease VII large subunit
MSAEGRVPRGRSLLHPDPAAVPGTTRESPMSITDLNDRTRALLEKHVPARLWIQGEVTDFKRNRNGHWYFGLRDSNAQISCVVWGSDQWRIPAPPDEGMQVIALAQMTFWPGKGTIQLRVTRLEASGDGLWRKAMELTVAKLKAEGLLADERKRPIPRYPRCVAVVTSTTGAALRDIISVAHRRRPGIRIVISAATVQGDGAPQSICRAIQRVVRWKSADVIIVGRGGGSREDLWAFNDEKVARAIAACDIPVISAVGHEVDITVCDLVADLRAATPSAAAESAVPALSDMHAALDRGRRRIRSAAIRRNESARLELRAVARDMKNAASWAAETRRAAIAGASGRLNALSPLATLARGYAVARSENGETLSSVADFEPRMDFKLQLTDGVVAATAKDVLI